MAVLQHGIGLDSEARFENIRARFFSDLDKTACEVFIVHYRNNGV